MNKPAVRKLAEHGLSPATRNDIAYEAYVREQIRRGLEQARNGQFASDRDVATSFARWGVQTEN